MNDRSPSNRLAKSTGLPAALVTGAALGLAMAIADSWLGVVGLIVINIGAPMSAMIQAAILHVLLGALLGLITFPVRKRFGPWPQFATLVLIWFLLLLYSGVPHEQTQRNLAIVGFVGGLTFLLIGRLIGRWRPRTAAGLGIALLLGALLVPVVRARRAADTGQAPIALPAARLDAPDVVLVVLDTVRADHVGVYGYSRDTSPHLDALASEGALYLDATAPATWSLPSHASLFTGRFPSGHQAHQEHRFLTDDAPTLAETLAKAGYDTRCFTANAWISDTLGLTRGFAWCDEAWRDGQLSRNRVFIHRLLDKLGFGLDDKGGDTVASNFERWAAERPADGPPAFTFVNFIEAHFPYHQVPKEFLARFSDSSRRELRETSMALMEAQFGGEPPDPDEARTPAIDMYDAGLAYADHLLGRLVEAVRQRGTLDRTIFVVLADHGELLSEHGAYGHGHSIYEAESRVPLVIRYPEAIRPGTRVETGVSTVGVFATILDLAGIPAPDGLQVSSLLPAIAGGAPGGPILSERYSGNLAAGRAQSLQDSDPLFRSDLRFRAYRVGNRKLVQSSDDSVLLFDLGEDPDELRDVVARRPDDLEQLRSELQDWSAVLGLPAIDAVVDTGEAPDLDPEARERLKALGYVN